MGFILQGIK